jgi:RNase adapter protein RapZ
MAARSQKPKAKKKAVAPAGARAKGPIAKKSTKKVNDGQLIIITGMSGSGKASALKAFEDLGYYAVDNLPIELIPHFANLILQSEEIVRAALVVDVRESSRLDRFPAVLKELRSRVNVQVIFFEASDDVLVRRFSETRRPHPIGRNEQIPLAIAAERHLLDPIRNVADTILDTSKFNVHELRAHVQAQFQRGEQAKHLLISSNSFGFKNGVPADADLVFDVRFLPNPHFVPEFRKLTGRDAKVAAYVLSFPQTKEFLKKTEDMLTFLLPHYIQEGKSYLTIAFGCTGGQHRSVFIAEEMQRRLEKRGYRTKVSHRDMPRS